MLLNIFPSICIDFSSAATLKPSAAGEAFEAAGCALGFQTLKDALFYIDDKPTLD